METIGGDGSKTGLVIKKKGEQKTTTDICASLMPDYREKEESNIGICLFIAFTASD